MDTARGATPASLSRLPTKKNSNLSLRDSREYHYDRRSPVPLSPSPSVVSDTSTNGGGGDAAAGSAHGYVYVSNSRRSSSSSQSSRVSQQHQTRIPRPSPSVSQPAAVLPTPRRPLSIKDAYRMAEEEEAAAVAAAAQGSPSPAPRPWRNSRGGAGNGGAAKGTPTPAAAAAVAPSLSASESRMQRILAQSPLNLGGRRTAARRTAEPLFPENEQPGDNNNRNSAHRRTSSSATDASGVGGADATVAARRIQHEEDQARMQVTLGERAGGLFSPKARVSPKIAVAGRELHRRASNSSLGERSSRVPVSISPGSSAANNRKSLPPGSVPQPSSLSSSSRGKTGSFLRRMVSAPESSGAAASHTESDTNGDGSPDGPSAVSPAANRPGPTRAATSIHPSPEKSFAWDADADFTVGELMVSESPPVKTGGELDISSTPAGNPPQQILGTPQTRPRNSKLDEIRQLEVDAALRFPDEAEAEAEVEAHARDEDELFPALSAEEVSHEAPPPRTNHRGSLPAERTNKTLDEIQAREKEGLSKRALSAAKLEEIRLRNAEFRAPSPGISHRASREQLPHGLAGGDAEGERDAGAIHHAHERSILEEEGERIPNTPITIYRTSSTDRERRPSNLLHVDDNGDEKPTNSSGNSGTPGGGRQRKTSTSSHSRSESQELLRKLARVTTSVTTIERKDKPSSASPGRLSEKTSGDSLSGGGGATGDSRTDKNLRLPRSRDSDTLRPTVGFASLRRVSSSDSASTKRSSVAQSDGDPTDRIEAEAKLFAPTENHSERGSIRAPSPEEDPNDDSAVTSDAKSSDMADDATPKPNKTNSNPLMQPTPRVTGAYVETPVTVKTEKMQEVLNAAAPEPPAKKDESARLLIPSLASLLRGPAAAATAAAATAATAAAATATASADEPDNKSTTTDRSSETIAREPSEARRRRSSATARQRPSRSQSRSRSASRARTPLINSAKPASARDDLLALQRAQQIDDSTLDGFDEVLAAACATALPQDSKKSGGGADSAVALDDDVFDKDNNQEIQRLLQEALKDGADFRAGDDDLLAADPERLKRMSRSLRTYISDVQRAKKGIERLEDQVSHPGTSSGGVRQEPAEDDGEEEDEETQQTKTRVLVTRQTKVKEEEDDEELKPVTHTMRKQRPPASDAMTTALEKKSGASLRAAAKGKPSPQPTPADPAAPSVRVPLPRLYRAEPDSKAKRLTLLGLLALLAAAWLACEGAACALYCRPEVCHPGAGSDSSCRWSPDDPSFGVALPVKLDQWLTGGRGRVWAAWAGDELGDLVADAWDAATGTDIRRVDPTYFTFDEKRRHRRRLQKRGLLPPWTPPAEARPKLEAWRRAREAREQARRAREEIGYGGEGTTEDDDADYYDEVVAGYGSSESMAADERVGGGWW